jgi:hypothetical protein
LLGHVLCGFKKVGLGFPAEIPLKLPAIPFTWQVAMAMP